LIIEEEQAFDTAALEKIRLLTCAPADAQPAFSSILCGDKVLLGRLELGSMFNRNADR